VLGLNTLQLNRDHDYGGATANQLATFEHIGLFKQPLPKPPEDLPKLVDYRDESIDLSDRARSYLHANCSHCHMKWGGGNADFQLLATLPADELGILNIRPAHGSFGIADARLVVPGDARKSIVHHRMSKLGLGHMPHVGSNVIHAEAVELIRQWIEQMGAEEAR